MTHPWLFVEIFCDKTTQPYWLLAKKIELYTNGKKNSLLHSRKMFWLQIETAQVETEMLSRKINPEVAETWNSNAFHHHDLDKSTPMHTDTIQYDLKMSDTTMATAIPLKLLKLKYLGFFTIC